MPEIPANKHDLPSPPDSLLFQSHLERSASSASFHELLTVLQRRRRFMAVVVGGLLSVCLLYCLVAPNVYEANARIALRATPATALSLNGADGGTSGAFASGQIQLETLANVFRSDQLAWRVITRQQLYRAKAFMGNFARRFPQFDPNAPSPDAQAFLLDRFHRRLTVQTLPRTLVLQIRFRSKDATLSAAVANGLITAYSEQNRKTRVQATSETTA